MHIPEHLHHRAVEILNMETDGADKRRLWSSIYRLTPFRDGSAWCVLLGENTQDGIAGFGATPVEALNEFEKAMYLALGQSGQKNHRTNTVVEDAHGEY